MHSTRSLVCLVATTLLAAACARSVAPLASDGATSSDDATSVDAPDGVGRLVYQNDFENSRDPLTEWTPRTTSVTPIGAHRFLGPFARGTVALELDDWAPHAALRVSFELFIIGSWDGSQERDPRNDYVVGPDHWTLVADGRVTLADATFSNIDGYGAERLVYPQSWPQDYPQARNPPHTSAVAVNSLGFSDSDGDLDATYRVALRFAHSGPALRLAITTNDPQTSFVDETWGIDDIVIQAEP